MSHSRKPIQLGVEPLEHRAVLTTAFMDNGILRVLGTDAAETIKVTQGNGRITIDGVGYVNASQVRGISVDARGGNDVVEMRTLTTGATILGGSGDDFIVGTAAADQVYAGYGSDRVFGMEGNDALHGGDQNDILFGMGGMDQLFGGYGDDFLDDGNRFSQEYADGGAGLDWNADVVAVGGTTLWDVNQRGAPTCSLLASLQGLANIGTDFSRWVRYDGFNGQGTPLYSVAFWNGRGWGWRQVEFTGQLYGTDTAPAAEGESWVILMQRAYIAQYGNGGRSYPHEALYRVAGRNASVKYSVQDADFSRIARALASRQVVIAATRSGSLSTSTLVSEHAYTVVATYGGGSNAWIQVRNPWGYDGGATAEGNANDGLIWVRWTDVKASFNYLAIS